MPRPSVRAYRFPFVPARKDSPTHQFAALLLREISPAGLAALFAALPTEGHRMRVLLPLRHARTLPYKIALEMSLDLY